MFPSLHTTPFLLHLAAFSLNSCRAVQTVPVQNLTLVGPLVLLPAAFSRTVHPNNFRLDSALPRVLSDTPASRDVDWLNGCRDN